MTEATVIEADDCNTCNHYDLVVIGAGPHALSLVTRLLERAPSSLISEHEHSRLHQLHSGKSHSGKKSFATPLSLDMDLSNKRILVIDKYGRWMERWDRSFQAYQISHLRSPLFFHMDPSDPDSLRTFAHSQERQDELHDITHLVDEGCKKCHRNSRKKKSMIRNLNHRDRELFYTPSTSLFADFCEDLIDRYQLHDMVIQGVCINVDTIDNGKQFRVTYECTDDGCHKETTIFADAVVSAIGNTNIKNIPQFIKDIPQDSYPAGRIAHAYDFVDCLQSGTSEHSCPRHAKDHTEITPEPVLTKIASSEPSSVLIVGGGLTSAQMVDIAVKRGFKKVILVMRSTFKVRQFDFSLDLMGRHSGTWFAHFWMEKDPKRRLAMIKKERNGGSITPEYAKLLHDYVEKGLLTIHQKTQVQSCKWMPSDDDNDAASLWVVQLQGQNHEELKCDQIWLATGSTFDIYQEPAFKTIASKYDIESVNGLPVLNTHLQLHPDLNFYVMSGYSSLVMGPTAANLQGGRIAAERIASELWDQWNGDDVDEYRESQPARKPRGTWNMADITANMGNYFSALADLE